MTDDDKIADLLLSWEEARERGESITAEELCRECPELLDAVRDRIRLLGNAGWMMKPSTVAPDKPRTLAERYSLEALIGSGGYAQVWRAYDLQLHRHVAVKVPKPSRTLTASQIEDVLTEARQIARLKHVGIVTVHDVVKEGAGYFIVTDLIDGETLAERLKRGPMPP
ncbi:MAG: protein kinase, partial [Gemmataceae bacterium]|nr:protein kinase [Gemmataceae bacterium]